MRRRSTATAGLILGLAVAVGVPAGWWFAEGSFATTAYAPDSSMWASPSASPTEPRLELTKPVAGSERLPMRWRPTVPDIPIVSTTTSKTKRPVPRPVRVVINPLDANAAVVPVGVDENRAVAVPTDAMRLGWYRFGRSPAEGMGSTVIVGHRDSREQGRGVLFRLDEVEPNDSISVELSDGSTVNYRVVEERFYLRERLPEVLFERSGAPRLTLITCGGPYDPERGYRDNLVVTAVPV